MPALGDRPVDHRAGDLDGRRDCRLGCWRLSYRLARLFPPGVRRTDGVRHDLADLGRLGRVVPQAVRAHQHPARTRHVHGRDLRHDVRSIDPEPTRDGVGVRRGLGLLARDPGRDAVLGHRVVAGENCPVAGVRQPVGPRVADVACVNHVVEHQRGHERAGCGVLLARRRVVRDGVVRHRGSAGEQPRHRRRPRRRRPHVLRTPLDQHIPGGTRGGQGGNVGVRRRRHAVADHQHRARAHRLVGVRREGVLVAGMLHAAIADRADPRRGRLLEVLALGRRLGSALGAVAVGVHLSPALQAEFGRRGLGRDRGRVRRRDERGVHDGGVVRTRHRGSGLAGRLLPARAGYGTPLRELRPGGLCWIGHRTLHRRVALACSMSRARSPASL